MKKLSKFKLLIGSAFLIIAGTIVGCGEDFLNAPPQGSLDEVTLANESGVEATLIGTYRVLGGWSTGIGGGWGAASSNWTFGSVASDDAYKGSENTDQPDIEDIEYYTWGLSGAEAYLNDKWRSVWEGVVRSNSTIRLLNSVQESDAPIGDAVANSIRGEALFLRAHFHFEAWKMWGNIPYFTEEDTETRKSNVGVDAVSLILADLNQAISLLPNTPRNGQVGRVTAWTAKAYKGRVEAYSGDLASALTTLRDVRQNGPYALEEDFHRVWTGFEDFQNGPETILVYQASVNDGNPGGDNANWGERLNFPHGGPLGTCCGFHQPSQNLANAFIVDGDGLPLAVSSPGTWNNNDDYIGSDSSLPLDPRIDWTIGRHGVPYLDWGPHAASWVRDPNFGGEYNSKKNVHEIASGSQSNVGWVPSQLNGVNFHLYRYADMLLLLAEAEVEHGSLENARAIVNEIRARAAVGVQGPGDDASTISVPIDDPSITWADYQVGQYPGPWTNQATARQAVRWERRVELGMEGHRFFDLRRWGTYQDVLNAYIQVERTRLAKLGNAAPLEGRHQWYAIPEIQIELSRVDGEETLVQNPGW
ncbi:MAG: RagB/SusD family nutrient uptake outer membrane protein [Balneolaceae bacterium]